MTPQTPDDGFREIQLNGKQLVFLFMAATVVSVVLFLCGVLVGRGVRAARSSEADVLALKEDLAAVPAGAIIAPVTEESADPRSATPPPAVEEPGDSDVLGRLARPADDQGPVTSGARSVTAATEKPAAVETASPRTVASAERPAAQAPVPSGPAAAPRPGDWAVQVAAVNVRGEADAIAKKLAAKGYATYVVSPPQGNPQMFRVRVGPFGTRREADATAVKLQTEEQFKPWVTR